MKEYVKQMGESEIGGLLLGKIKKNGDFVVENAILLEQEKTNASFSIDDGAMMELVKNGSAKLLSSIVGWWHSHGVLKTFWSLVDDDCFKRLVEMLNGRCFGIVMANLPDGKFSMRNRMDVIDKTGCYISVDNIIVQFDNKGKITVDKKSIAKEIKKKVRDEPKKELKYKSFEMTDWDKKSGFNDKIKGSIDEFFEKEERKYD